MSYLCPICKKEFPILYPSQYVYKRGTKDRVIYLCSYSCMREYDKRKGPKMKLTNDQKEQAVKIAIIGGDPLEYLEKCGSLNPSSIWYEIKKKLKTEDPETYKELAASYHRRPKQGTPKAEKEKIAEPAASAVMDMACPSTEPEKELPVETDIVKHGVIPAPRGTKKITKPVNYAGYDVTAIRHKELGQFFYDSRHKTVDWWTDDGDEISMTPRGWKMLIDELPKMLAVLGVDLNDQGDT